MKIATRMIAQGDVMFRRVARLPPAAKKVERPADGRAVVAHSETGHHHVAELPPGWDWYTTKDPLVSYLAGPAASVDIIHERTWDTHEQVRLSPEVSLPDPQPEMGQVVWEIRRQREMAPDGWRMVVD